LRKRDEQFSLAGEKIGPCFLWNAPKGGKRKVGKIGIAAKAENTAGAMVLVHERSDATVMNINVTNVYEASPGEDRDRVVAEQDTY
jgi:hypothetical protein